MSRLTAAAVVFILSALVPFFVRWLRARRWGLAVNVYVGRDDPRPKEICGYLAEIASRLDERPERMRVVFHAPRFVYVLCSLVAAAGLVFFSPEPVALALGASIGCATAAK